MSGPSSNSPRQQQRMLQQQNLQSSNTCAINYSLTTFILVIPLPDDKLVKSRPLIPPQPIAAISQHKIAQNGHHNFTADMPSSLSIGWPVSPIAAAATLPSGRLFMRDCESPTMVSYLILLGNYGDL
jgi:hypothetical protein